MSEDKEPEMIKPNKTLFLERYFSYFSDKFKKELLGRIRTRQSLRKRGILDDF